MKIELFDFILPEELIAKYPLKDREAARLLIPQGGECVDRQIKDLPDILKKDTLIVFNDTKVIPARLYGVNNNREFEVTLFEKTGNQTWEAMIKNSKKLKTGGTLNFGAMKATVKEKKEDGRIVIEFDLPDHLFYEELEKVGSMPLPPYMKRRATKEDLETYQSVFAKEEGAVAAPTASLHFTERLLQKIKEKGIESVAVTLHVGAGTFLPVKVSNLEDHVMHFEHGVITKETADKINQAKKAGKKILAIGTTALRVVESASDENGVRPFAGRTNLFITPGYRFKTVDRLLTNFHLPKSTLFVLVSAFSGIKRMKSVYDYAIRHRYRFFSYGDAMLLTNEEDMHP